MRRPHADIRYVVAGAALGVLVVWRVSRRVDLMSPVVVAPTAVAVVAVVAGALPLMQRAARHPGVVPAQLLATLALIYACVPETDQIPQVLAVVLALLAIETSTERPQWWLSAPVASWVMWAGLVGAAPRASAMVGALFAWWPLVVWAVLSHGRRAPREWPVLLAWVSAVVVARTGALRERPEWALVEAVVAVVLTVVVAAISSRASGTTGVRERAAAHARWPRRRATGTARSDGRSRPR